MKFSTVITTYNRLPLLKRAIASALAQTHPCEVVVVDDCSEIETQAYVSSLSRDLEAQGDTRLVYLRNATNLGHSKCVNLGVEKAVGEWIKLLDDDDYLAANCIEEIDKAIALHPQAAICSCQAAQVDEQEIELRTTKKVGPGKAFYIPQEDIHCGMLMEQVPFGTPVQVAFRRDAFLQSGGWDSGLDTNFDDIDSWIKIAQFGDAIFINQCLTYRTVWPGAFNQKFSIQERLETNILIKQKIYPLVHPQHHARIPSLTAIANYLRLHWGLIALKKLQLSSALSAIFPALFDAQARILLLNRLKKQPPTKMLADRENRDVPLVCVRKLVLIER